MTNTITREELKEKIERGDRFALVEVQPEAAYRNLHLPGALNVPLLILRQETEWSYLVEGGKALLIGNRPESILTHLSALDEAALMRMRARMSGGPSGAAQRSVNIIAEWLAAQEDRHARTDSQPARAALVGA